MFNSTGSRVVPVTKHDTNYITGLVWTPEQGAEQTPTSADLTANTFTLAGHGLANGDKITINSLGTVTGTGIEVNAVLFVVGVSGNDFQWALTYGGSAIDLGGATTTLPTFRKTSDISTGRIAGFISVATSGNVAVLPLSHPDTNTTTEADLGAQIIYIAAGSPFPLKVKKVFSTGTDATGIKCIVDADNL